MSEVLGHALLLAAAAAMVAGAAVSLSADVGAPPAPAGGLQYSVELPAGADFLVLRHEGGPAVPVAELRATVSAGGAVLAAAAQPEGPTTWSIGASARVNLTTPPAPGARVEVTLVAPALRLAAPVQAVVALAMPGAASSSPVPPANTTIQVRFLGDLDYALANRTATLHLFANVTHPEGRRAVREVSANLSSLHGPSWVRLRDEGDQGDVVAGDATYTLVLGVPADAPVGVHELNVTASLADGSRAVGRGEIVVLPFLQESPSYNGSVVERVGWHISKRVSRDEIVVDFKAELRNSTLTVNGSIYRLLRVDLQFVPFKPGQTGLMSLATTSCDVQTVSFARLDAGILGYDADVDVLQYYFRLAWEKTAGTGPQTVFTNVEAQPPLQYFTLRPSEVEKHVGYPWTSHTDCTTA